MPNHCINYVSFRGDEDSVNKFKEHLNQKIEESISNDKYVWGELGDCRGVFFEEYLDENQEDYNHFICISAWSPEIDLFQKLAEIFNVEFCIQFEELGNTVYGVAIVDSKTIQEVYLEAEDIDKFVGGEYIDFDAMDEYLLSNAKEAGLDIF